MALSQALQKYDWLTDYMWKAVAVDADKYTRKCRVATRMTVTYPGAAGQKTVFPVQACLYMANPSSCRMCTTSSLRKKLGAAYHYRCATAPGRNGAAYRGLEFYIKKGAKLTFT